MDTVDAIKTRRAAKGFSSLPVTKEALLKLVDLARYSPSGGNRSAWQFVLITERKALDQLSETHRYCQWFKSAPAGIAIMIDPKSTKYWLEDCSVAAQTIWLAAQSFGLAVGWAAMHQSDSVEESERRQRLVRGILSIPETLCVPMVLGVGFHKAPLPEKKRPSLDDIVSWESYSKRRP